VVSTSDRVIECLKAKQSFIVEAGAGSGKTRTLVEALAHLLAVEAGRLLSGNQQIVCITYTNVAANEIMSRINRDPLVRVSTIHEFLWSVVRGFQAELRTAIVKANDAAGSRRIETLDLTDAPIDYWQYPRKWEDGKISHDDVIALSAVLFDEYPKLVRLVADRYPIIFVDEYQDTHRSTIKLLLDNMLAGNSGRLTVGLFGDHMQRIYNAGVGKVERPELRVIQKTENYRCSIAVIGLLNKLRPELQQVPGGTNVEGSARFIYASPGVRSPVAQIRAKLHVEGWTEQNEKVLMLTRKSIASDLEWRDLLAAYDQRSGFSVDDLMRRDDEFGELFSNIEAMASAFSSGQYGVFLALRAGSSDRITHHAEKKLVSDVIARLNELRTSATVGEVVDYVWNEGLLRKPRRVLSFEEQIAKGDNQDQVERDRAFLSAIRAVPFAQVVSFERYLNSETPFSTNHGVKGEEYENVLVVLDDNLWNQYKFEAVLSGDTSRTQYQRSLNLLYVSCSRAKRNLLVFVVSPLSQSAVDGAKRIFGADNVSVLANS
jgi:DNA helicase-2/ATP-dependent DNA helicase PcrA